MYYLVVKAMIKWVVHVHQVHASYKYTFILALHTHA